MGKSNCFHMCYAHDAPLVTWNIFDMFMWSHGFLPVQTVASCGSSVRDVALTFTGFVLFFFFFFGAPVYDNRHHFGLSTETVLFSLFQPYGAAGSDPDHHFETVCCSFCCTATCN